MQFLEYAKTIAVIPAPSGFETRRIAVISDIAKDFAEDIRFSPNGSLILHRAGKGKKVLLTTHADSAGFLTTYKEAAGHFRVGALGPVDAAAAVGTRVASPEGGIAFLGTDNAAPEKGMKLTELYLDPLTAADTGRAYAFCGDFYGEGDICFAPALSSALACGILLEVFAQAGIDLDLWVAFTAQHMLGARDAGAVAFTVQPDYAVTLDALRTESGKCAVGSGAVVSHHAGRYPAHPAIGAALVQSIEGSVQQDFKGPPVSDLFAIQKTGAGVPTGAVGLPVENLGQPWEKASIADARALCDLLQGLLKSEAL